MKLHVLYLSVILLGNTLCGAEFIAGMKTEDFNARYDKIERGKAEKQWSPASVSAPERKKILQQADKITEGFVYFYDKEPVFVGKNGIDWFGGQKKHQEWVAQLNRFFMLESLGRAYILTGEERYAERAGELIDDYCLFLKKHNHRFFDPQDNNRLNLSMRINNWILALRQMGTSKAFDDIFLNRMNETLSRQLNSLRKITKPGAHNFFAVQSHALLTAGLKLPELPGADEALKHGSNVFAESMKLQFRQDGTQVENTCNYHQWMLELAGHVKQLSHIDSRLNPGLTEQQFRNALDFCHLAKGWGINDDRIPARFPVFYRLPGMFTELAERFDLPGWKPPERQSFADAGLFFAGNDREMLFFDAATGSAGHQHNARLNALYSAYGYAIIADYGIKNYERTSPFNRAGMETASHATCQPDDLVQFNRPDAARTLLAVNRADFAVFRGEYREGYGTWGKLGPDDHPEIRALHRRTLVWLPAEYILIIDRLTGADIAKATHWNFNFPIPCQEKYSLNVQTGEFKSENGRQRPNFTIRLLGAFSPSGKSPEFKLVRYYGQKKPLYRGWRGTRLDGIPMPLLSFQGTSLGDGSCAVFLVAARPPGEPAPEYRTVSAGNGWLEILRPDGGRDYWTRLKEKSPVPFEGEALLIRYDRNGRVSSCFGINLKRCGKQRFQTPFSGFLKEIL